MQDIITYRRVHLEAAIRFKNNFWKTVDICMIMMNEN